MSNNLFDKNDGYKIFLDDKEITAEDFDIVYDFSNGRDYILIDGEKVYFFDWYLKETGNPYQDVYIETFDFWQRKFGNY